MSTQHTHGLSRTQVLEIAEKYGEFQHGDAQGHKRLEFAADVIAARERIRDAAPDLLEACLNARDMLAVDRQAFVDCQALRDSRTDSPIAHGLVAVGDDVWITPEDAEALRDYDRALALIDAAVAKATGQKGGAA